MASRTLCVGLGSPHGDDQLGWLAADRLLEIVNNPDSFKSMNADTTIRKAANPVDLLDWLEDFDCLIICDACQGGVAAGTIYRWVWPEPSIERTTSAGTHQFCLSHVLDMAALLDRLPKEVIVWAMQVESVEPAADLSDAVQAALTNFVLCLQRDLEDDTTNSI